jgi:tetratricopeptide (TPR) repeat protein
MNKYVCIFLIMAAGLAPAYTQERSFDELNKAIADEPENASLYRERSHLYGKAGQYINEFNDIERAVELEPNEENLFFLGNAYINLGIAYKNFDMFQDAVRIFTQVIAMNPAYEAAYSGRGLCYIMLQDYQKAVDDYNKRIEMNPVDGSYYGDRGVAYMVFGKFDEALADFNQHIKLSPDDAGAYYWRAGVYSELEKYPEALADCNRAIVLPTLNLPV